MKSAKVHKLRYLIALLVLSAAALFAGVFASCASNDVLQQLIDQGYIHTVTYDANGGDFNPSPSIEQLTIEVRVKDNSLTVEPGYRAPGAGELDGVSLPTRSGYELTGWQLVTVGEDGKETLTPWDFANDRVTGNITLRAVWIEQIVLTINAVDGTGTTIATETILREGYGSFVSALYDAQNIDGQSVYTLRADTIRRAWRTFEDEDGNARSVIGFYWLDDNNERVDLTVENAVFAEGERSKTLYAEVLDGEYEFITQDNASRTSLESSSRWYLLEDVDFGMSYNSGPLAMNVKSWNALESFNGVIYGNGHTISNIWIKDEIGVRDISGLHSIFGDMSGQVYDLTFENVEYTVYSYVYGGTVTNVPTITIAFLANQFPEEQDGSVPGLFKDVTLNNAKLSVVNASYEYELEGETVSEVRFNAVIVDDYNYYWINQPSTQQSVTGSITYESYVDTDLQ